MKLAISGVPGTGKTTLTKLIAENTDLLLRPEIEDVVLLEMGYKTGRELIMDKGDEGFLCGFLNLLNEK